MIDGCIGSFYDSDLMTRFIHESSQPVPPRLQPYIKGMAGKWPKMLL
jgi:hypothetical protein